MSEVDLYNKNIPLVIAEIGCNHKGDFKIAIEMLKIAKDFCKVDIVKFQKRCNKELLSEKEYAHSSPKSNKFLR